MNRNLREAFRAAGAGLVHALNTQRNLRLQCGVAATVVSLAWWLNADGTQIALLILAIGLVVTSEILNTSVEVLAAPTRNAHERRSPPARIAKDLGAAAVVVAAGVAAAVGIAILGPLLLERIGVAETAWVRAATVASVVAAGAVGAAWRWVLRT